VCGAAPVAAVNGITPLARRQMIAVKQQLLAEDESVQLMTHVVGVAEVRKARACRRRMGWRLPLWDSETMGNVMGSKLATIVVEPRLLAREALKSLMAKNGLRYRVHCGRRAGPLR
jgi:hypothetical protein